jgi:phosphohistidine phosphatase
MKKLIIMRHAKSSWDLPLSDIQRPLNERGLRNAPEMGRRILKSKIIPEIIYTSDAVRAYTTAQLVREALHLEIPIEVEPKIYDTTLQVLLNIIHHFPEKFSTILMVGHNPTISLLANYLSGDNVGYFATGAMACLEFSCNWNEVSGGTGNLVFFDYPKNTNSPFM